MDKVVAGTPVVPRALGPEDETPSLEWTFVSMLKEITAQERRFNRIRRYVEGDPPKPDTPQSLSAGESDSWIEFEAFREKSRTNYAELIVGACLDRTILTGFRTAAAGDEDGDIVAEEMWDRNDMAVKSDEVLSDMFTYGHGYLLADPFTKRAKVFNPWQAYSLNDVAGDPLAAITVEHRPMERRDYAYLWIRDVDDFGLATGQVWCHIAVRDRENPSGTRLTVNVPRGTYMSRNWQWWKSEKTTLETIPLVDFENRGGVGEFERHTDTLDRINHMLLQRVVIATMQAFRQRALKGKFPEFDERGNPIDYNKLFPSSPGALWLIPEDSDLWESAQAIITDILASVKDDVRDLAATTRTPMTYFSPDSANGSAEGASLQREGYTSKIEDRKARLAGRWRRFMGLMFDINGDAIRSDVTKIEIIWTPTEMLSLAERYSAGAQASGFMMPLKTIMREVLYFTPRQVRTADLERISQSLTQAAATPVGQQGTGTGSGRMTPLQRNAAARVTAAAGAGTGVGSTNGNGP